MNNKFDVPLTCVKFLFKGIKCASEDRQMRYDEELIVPIIENTPFEADLADSMSQVWSLAVFFI